MGQTFVKTRTAADGGLKAIQIPDHLDVNAEMACGAQLHMQISRVTGIAGPSEIFLFGSEGTLRFCNGCLYGGKRGDVALSEIPINPSEAGAWRVEEEFINAIRGLETIRLTTFEDGVKYMDFTEAVARSIQRREWISLPS
jgi:predicted dehydrogenase